jgi:hypothetical protein
MAQPTAYNRAASFSNIQALAPADPLPGATVDTELNNIKRTLDEVLANLELIQRDDGELASESVGYDQLSTELSAGINRWETWVTATAYAVGDTVFNGSAVYRCATAHTSSTFATDLGAAKWTLIIDLAALTLAAATNIANTPAGNIAATTVQAAINELDSEKAAASHTHPSSAITDGTAAGRAMFTAANIAAQKALLELGDLAFLDTIPVTNIAAELALTGIIAPAALAASVNDWTPTGIATASTVRASASSSNVNITGMSAAAADGTLRVLENIGGTYPLTLLPDNAGSAAANRFAIPRPLILQPNTGVICKYDLDETTPRWRLLQSLSAQPPAGVCKNLRVYNVATPFGDSAPSAPSTEVKISADAISLEDTNGEVYLARSVSLTASSGSVGANALDAGTVANSTWYSTWVIFNPTTNTIASLLSTSATAPTMPSGYTFKARVGWRRTNGSALFERILQIGRRAQYVVGASVTTALKTVVSGSTGDVAAPTYSAASVAAIVPATASEIALVMQQNFGTTAMAAPNASYGAASSTTNPAMVANQWSANTNSGVHNTSFTMMLESTSVYYASNSSGNSLFCSGWTDNF